MNHALEVSASVIIDAPAEKVWDPLTKPELIKEYLFGTETSTDWNIGSDIFFEGEWEGKRYRDKGSVMEYIPLKRIAYSYWSGFTGLEDSPENYSKVIYDLEATGQNETRFTWTQKGFGSEEGHQHSLNGMEEFLQGFKAVAER